MIQFSGGAGSWAAARRVAERYGTAGLVLLCADTRSEHEDWRPFIDRAAADIGAPLVILNQGDDIWDLADRQRMIPNTRADFCSRILKREPLRAWVDEHCDPATTTIYFGFDWTEAHRLDRARPYWEPWMIDAPLTWDPPISKDQILSELAESGLPMPAAYATGMPHNNCLKYGCVKGGQAYWRKLYDSHPDAYRRAEHRESTLRAAIGKDVSILRDRSGSRAGRGAENVKPLTLRAFRQRIEAQPSLFDSTDWGACSCMDDGS